MKHKHIWKQVGYYSAGWGISTDCVVYWCNYCGTLKKTTLGLSRTTKPKVRYGK